MALSAAKKRTGWSYRQLAVLTGLSAGYLCRLLHGERCPRPATAEILIIVLNLDEEVAGALREEAAMTAPKRTSGNMARGGRK